MARKKTNQTTDSKQDVPHAGANANSKANDSRKGQDAARVIIERSRRMLIDHYEHRDLDAVISCVADDVTWFGPMDCQNCQSAESMRALLQPEYHMRMRMRDEQWSARRVGEAWLVMGLCVVATRPEEGAPVVEFHQKVTFVWAMTSQGFRIVHLHSSNAHDIPPRASAPLEPGDDALAYSLASFFDEPEGLRVPKLSFQNVVGTVSYLSPEEILCLTVEGGQTVRILHENGSFAVRGALSELAKSLPEAFVRVHRSCIVNAARVAEIVRYRITLDDGTRCPVAEKRYRAIREEIESRIA